MPGKNGKKVEVVDAEQLQKDLETWEGIALAGTYLSAFCGIFLLRCVDRRTKYREEFRLGFLDLGPVLLGGILLIFSYVSGTQILTDMSGRRCMVIGLARFVLSAIILYATVYVWNSPELCNKEQVDKVKAPPCDDKMLEWNYKHKKAAYMVAWIVGIIESSIFFKYFEVLQKQPEESEDRTTYAMQAMGAIDGPVAYPPQVGMMYPDPGVMDYGQPFDAGMNYGGGMGYGQGGMDYGQQFDGGGMDYGQQFDGGGGMDYGQPFDAGMNYGGGMGHGQGGMDYGQPFDGGMNYGGGMGYGQGAQPGMGLDPLGGLPMGMPQDPLGGLAVMPGQQGHYGGF